MENDLAVHINEELVRRGWSQRELARRSGLSATAISQIVNGTVAPMNNSIVRIALALNEDPQHLLRLAGHLPAALPETDLDRAVNDAFRHLSDTQRAAIATIVCELAGRGTPEIAPVGMPSLSAQRLTEKIEAMALWGDVCTEMEYCAMLMLDGASDHTDIERHYLVLQTTLVNLLWTLMEPPDHPDIRAYAQRLLNAHRRHRIDKRGESEAASAANSS